jgi:hypothetical protein
LVQWLAELPDGVRARRFWPFFDYAAAETFAVWPVGHEEPDLFVRDADHSWWLRQPAEGIRRLGRLLPTYSEYYEGRRRDSGGVTWWRASDRALLNLLFKLGETLVMEFGPAPATTEQLEAFGLRPPTVSVRVVLADGRVRSAAVGHEIDRNRMVATRQDVLNVLEVTNETRADLLSPLADYLDMSALPFRMATADSFVLQRNDRPPLHVRYREGEWRTHRGDSTPAAGHQVSDEELLGDIVVYLDRLSFLAALPPRPEENPLQPGYRVILRAWFSAEGTVRQRDVVFGRLPGDDGVGAYFPADGRYLHVPAEILTTLRSLFYALEADRP